VCGPDSYIAPVRAQGRRGVWTQRQRNRQACLVRALAFEPHGERQHRSLTSTFLACVWYCVRDMKESGGAQEAEEDMPKAQPAALRRWLPRAARQVLHSDRTRRYARMRTLSCSLSLSLSVRVVLTPRRYHHI
jgi:hypothetical protein